MLEPQYMELLLETAEALQMSPRELLKQMSYETSGTLDPMKKGPTTQWGQHKGLIQFGEPQRKQFGVDLSSRDAAFRSQLGRNGAVVKYMKAHGFKPGQHSGLDMYSTINAGAPGRYGASDANNGGAPGSVMDKYNKQMAGHDARAQSILSGSGFSYGDTIPQQSPLPGEPRQAALGDDQEEGLNENSWKADIEDRMANSRFGKWKSGIDGKIAGITGVDPDEDKDERGNRIKNSQALIQNGLALMNRGYF